MSKAWSNPLAEVPWVTVANSHYHSQSSHTGITCDKAISRQLSDCSEFSRRPAVSASRQQDNDSRTKHREKKSLNNDVHSVWCEVISPTREEFCSLSPYAVIHRRIRFGRSDNVRGPYCSGLRDEPQKVTEYSNPHQPPDSPDGGCDEKSRSKANSQRPYAALQTVLSGERPVVVP